MGKIDTFLWFDGRAEEAATLYTSLFDGSRIVGTSRYGEAGPGPKGSVMMVSFQLLGLPTALGELLADPDKARAQRVMKAMLGMRKLDIAALRAAAQ